MSAIRKRASMQVLIKKGRMLSKYRITVMAQYNTAMHTWKISVPLFDHSGMEHTMLRIATMTDGGVAPALTISEMKLAVIPITAIIEAI